MPQIPGPPSNLTGPVAEYLKILWRAVNDLPNISKFSGATPNSTVTDIAGGLAINVGIASNDSRLFVKGGSGEVPSNSGWVTVMVAP